MSETVKLWTLNMLDTELKTVEGDISNNKVWLKGCGNDEMIADYKQHILDLEEYREVLIQMKKKIEEGDLDI